MSNIAIKIAKTTALSIGALGLVTLSSPWMLSHPTCLQFACSFLSKTLHVDVDCQHFEWQPFKKTAVSGLTISKQVGTSISKIQIDQLVIDDPLLAVMEVLKGRQLIEVLPKHARITSLEMIVNAKKLLELSLTPSFDSAPNSRINFVLYPKEAALTLNEVYSGFFNHSFSSILDRLPAVFEIPVIVSVFNDQLQFSFPSEEFYGFTSVRYGESVRILSEINTKASKRHFHLSANADHDFSIKELESSLVVGDDQEKIFTVGFANNALQLKLDVTDRLLPIPMMPQHLVIEGSYNFNESQEYLVSFRSDFGTGLLQGKADNTNFIIEHGECSLNTEKIGLMVSSYLPKTFKDGVILKDIALMMNKVLISKETLSVNEGAFEAKIAANLPIFGFDQTVTQLLVTGQDSTWTGSIESCLTKDSVEFTAFTKDSKLFVATTKQIAFSEEPLKQISMEMNKTAQVDDLRLESMSFIVPFGGAGAFVQDLQTFWKVNDIHMTSDRIAFATGPLSIDLQSHVKANQKEWIALVESGEDKTIIAYQANTDDDSTINETVEVLELPLGKWLGETSSYLDISNDFKVDTLVGYQKDGSISVKMKGSSVLDELACLGSITRENISIDQLAFTRSPREEQKRKLTVEAEGLNYQIVAKELKIKDALFKDEIPGHSSFICKARSIDAGIEAEMIACDDQGQTKLHLEGVFSPILRFDVPQKLRIEADHCPLSIFRDRHLPFAEELYNILGEEVTCSLQLSEQDLKTRFRSNKWMLSFSGLLEDGYFISKKPFFAQITLDPLSLEQFGKWIPLANDYQFTHPLNIRIDENSLRIPLKEFSWANVTAKGSIELGQFIAPSPSFGKPLFTLLKQNEMSESLSYWTTPLDIDIDHGKISVDRIDLLVQDKLHFAFWGNGDLNANKMHFHLGVAQDTLKALFGMQELPHDFLLSLPLVYKNQKIDLDFKESLKTIEQFLLLQGTVSGALPSWLDQFLQLGKHAALPYPALQYRLPWEVARAETVTKKSKNKLKPKAQEQNEDKPKESNSTLDKAKEWVELFKVFKVLN